MKSVFLRIVTESWSILCEMSPYLLFGFVVAGILSIIVSAAWVERNLGGRGFAPILKASLFGIPLPLCSCGIIPVAASIRHHGSSKAATTSFMLSTPQTGVDSIAITYGMLGPVFAVFRPLAALVTGLVGGTLVNLLDKNGSADRVEGTVCRDECCVPSKKRNSLTRIADYGLIRLPGDIGIALLVGVLISGVITVLVPEDFLSLYIGSSFLSILVMMLVGVPLYVCATASVPIAVGFIHMGASEGAALAFLIAGPATNAAAITTTWNIMGRKSALIYIATVAVSAIGFGLLLDAIMPYFNPVLNNTVEHAHSTVASGWIAHLWGGVMLAVLALSYIVRKKRKSTSEVRMVSEITNSESGRYEFTVTGMRCSHCSDTVRRGLSEANSVKSVQVDLDSGRVIVEGSNINVESLYSIIKSLGYGIKPE